MTSIQSRYRKIVKFFASLKFAVVILIAMGALIAWGTIVEAMYMDAKMAQETVYHSWFSYTIFGGLALTLIAVMLDRYPWKRHHVGFVCAHIGILILLIGSLYTRYYGIDGSISIDIGATQNRVSVGETDVMLYTTLDGESFKKFFETQANFFQNPPNEKNPIEIPLPSGDLKIIDFYPYALMDAKFVQAEEANEPPAIRFQISNERVMQSEWIMGKKGAHAEYNMGPATIVLTEGKYDYKGGNVLVIKPLNDKKVSYEIFSDRQKARIKTGEAEAGAQFNTGWMNLEFRLLKYLNHAKQDIQFKKKDQSTSETQSAIKFRFKNKEQWLGLNSLIRLFGDSEMYVLSYGNRRIPLDFNIHLRKFEVGRYQGTNKASTYESLVYIPEARQEVRISMNEPLKYNGYTFYQASFKEDPATGEPVASVLSVNRDPGRWLKYLGSLLIVIGSIHLFYRRWKKARTGNA